MSKTTLGGLHAAQALCAGLLCVAAAHAADDKPKVVGTDKATTRSASSPQTGAKQSKNLAGEKSGAAAPSSTDTDKGGNIAGIKKPSPPKVPQDAAAKKNAAQQ